METIDTIITNAHTLANAHIDWSPTAGPIWLAGMMVGMMILSAFFWIEEIRRERRVTRKALYRKAEAKANIRRNRMERQGFQEII